MKERKNYGGWGGGWTETVVWEGGHSGAVVRTVSGGRGRGGERERGEREREGEV